MDPINDLQRSDYRRLARLMSDDKNLAIFRRFDDVNILCLLSLQAEILHLRRRFYINCHVDETDGTEDEKLYGKDFGKSRLENSQQHQSLEQLREKLTIYS
jgi:hypothetical protein